MSEAPVPADQSGAICFWDGVNEEWVIVSLADPLPILLSGSAGFATAALQGDVITALGLQATAALQGDVITALGLQSTAALQAAQEVSLDAIQAAVERGTDDVASVLYNGGGAANALAAPTLTAALFFAGTAGVIPVGNANLIRVWLTNTIAAQSCTFKVCQFSTVIPAVANQTAQFERMIGIADHSATVDRAAFGLLTGTEYPVKDPIEISVAPGSWLMLGLSVSLGGTWYALYELRYE